MKRKSNLILATIGLTAIGPSLASAHGMGGGGFHGGGASMHLPSYSAMQSAPRAMIRASSPVFRLPPHGVARGALLARTPGNAGASVAHVPTGHVVAPTVSNAGNPVAHTPSGPVVAPTVGNAGNPVAHVPTGPVVAPTPANANNPEPRPASPSAASTPQPTPTPMPGQNKPFPMGMGGGAGVFGNPAGDDPADQIVTAVPASGGTIPASSGATTRTGAGCTCLTKQYLNDGSVLFRDVCTNEAVVAMPNRKTAATAR